MLYDIEITAEALRAASNWAMEGPNAAPVQLLVDDRMLVVSQGDERTAFDTDGSVGSGEYIALAPLDREPKLNQHLVAKLNALQTALTTLATPNLHLPASGQDARDMASFARTELDRIDRDHAAFARMDERLQAEAVEYDTNDSSDLDPPEDA